MMPGLRTLGNAAAVVAVVLAGCANSAAAGDEMVIELSIGGGLVPQAVRVGDSLPRVWIGAGGRYLRQIPDGSPTRRCPRSRNGGSPRTP